MIEKIGASNKSREPYKPLSMDFYAEDLLKNFLISKKIPSSEEEKNGIDKISKNLTTIIWIGKSNVITSIEESKTIYALKELKDNLHLNNLFEQTSYILQDLKNISEKASTISHVVDIAYTVVKTENIENFENILDKIIDNIKQKTDTFSVMLIDRELQTAKNNYAKDLNINNLLDHLEIILKL